MYKHFFLFLVLLALACFSQADGWIEVKPTGDVPPPVSGHTMVEMNGKFYLFGGQTVDGRSILNTLFVCESSGNEWKKEVPANDPPAARYGHSAVVYNRKMYVFFGQGAQGNLDDVWAYDYAQKTWEKQTTPSTYVPEARNNHASAVAADKAYVFGGKMAPDKFFGDLWAYNFADKTWTVQSYTPSGPTYGASMAASGGKLYMFGGQNSSGVHSETWAYDIAQKIWTYTNPSSFPPARKLSVAVQNLENLWVYGGTDNAREGEKKDIWQYNFATNAWTQKADGPVAQSQSAGILLPQANGQDVSIFVFGGISPQGTTSTTWQYYSSPQPPDPPQPSQKGILAQIGALGKGRLALYRLSYDKDQAKVKIDIQWAQDKAKLSLWYLHVPFGRAENTELNELEESLEAVSSQEDLENFHRQHIRHFKRLKVEQAEQQERKGISHTMSVKHGTLILFVGHDSHTPTARDIQVQISEMTNLPKKVQYFFQLGNPDKNDVAQKHFVQFPVTPSRWHSCYPNGTGKESIESGNGLWKWNFEEKYKFAFIPLALITFELP